MIGGADVLVERAAGLGALGGLVPVEVIGDLIHVGCQVAAVIGQGSEAGLEMAGFTMSELDAEVLVIADYVTHEGICDCFQAHEAACERVQ